MQETNTLNRFGPPVSLAILAVIAIFGVSAPFIFIDLFSHPWVAALVSFSVIILAYAVMAFAKFYSAFLVIAWLVLLAFGHKYGSIEVGFISGFGLLFCSMITSYYNNQEAEIRRI